MRIYYFVHITGTDTGISGVPRVVRNLARELVRLIEAVFVPVCWRADVSAIVHAEPKLLDNLSRHGGPALTASAEAMRPIAPVPGDWLLIAEVPHLQSHIANHPPVHLDEAVGGARRIGLKVAIVLHDILPLTFGVGAKGGQAFVEMSPAQLQARDDSVERLAFARYAHATALVDLVLPVSRTAGETLRNWLIGHGHPIERLPPIAPAPLPEEIYGARREDPRDASPSGTMEFLAVGFVNAQKNQLAAMVAFLRLVERRPDLDLRLHLVGLIASDVAAAASLLVKRAKSRILMHGRLPDGQIREMTRRSRATVFVSLAEGFGLPVAESLWRGKPCLCSNRGSIGEIARGGGCLAVDPSSLEAISAGFETLAADAERYEQLLREIAARPFKTWRDYARQIMNALEAVSSGRELVEDEPPAGAGRAETDDPSDVDEARRREAVLFLSAADWLVPNAYSGPSRARSLFYSGALHYETERDAATQEETLFFGPYVPLPAGHYAFGFDGELDGELKLAFTARDGVLRLVETTVRDFEGKIAFDLPEPVERFEIVGMRTPQLRRLTLRAAYGELSARAQEPAALEAPAPEPLALGVVPAARMRVHDAYKSGQGRRLRDGAAIAFDRAKHGDVEERTLFYGPYIDLQQGRYSLRLCGALEGALKLRLTRDFGQHCLRELVLTHFEAPVVFDLDQPAKNFEAVGARTEETLSLRLDAIEIVAAAPGSGPSWWARMSGRQ